jgi:plasmid stabilization system protein ParE
MPTTRLTWSARAKAELKEIGDYIAQDNRRAARKFVSRLKLAAKRLKDSPEGGSVVEELGLAEFAKSSLETTESSTATMVKPLSF